MDKQLTFEVIMHVLCMCMQCGFTHQIVLPVVPLNYYLALAHFDGNYNNKQTQTAGGTKIIMHITNNTDDLCTA
jgi:hypothetical protein